MYYLLVAMMACTISAQTRVRPDQMVVPVGMDPEDAWCLRPALEVSTSRVGAVIGKNWSASRPCYLHFNLTPPIKVDPVNVSSFSEPVLIQIKAGFVLDEDVYVYAIAPTFVPMANAKIQLRVRNMGSVTCGQCTGGVTMETAAVRLFPSNTLPIGMIAIRGGKFTPKADDILSHMQTYIGPGASMSVKYDQGGYWFQVDPTTAQLAHVTQAANALKATQALAVARATVMTPISDSQVRALQTGMKHLLTEVAQIRQELPPTPEARQRMMQEYEDARTGAHEMLSHMREEVRARAEQEIGMLMYNAALRVEPPASPNKDCGAHSWAQDDKYLYRCIPALQTQAPASWVRYSYDRKWK